jgi:hypothetical protein
LKGDFFIGTNGDFTNDPDEGELTTRSRLVHIGFVFIDRSERNNCFSRMKKIMTKTASAIIGLTMALALAGASFAAQAPPAPAKAPAAASATGSKGTKAKGTKKGKKGTKKGKKTSAVTAAPAK